MTTQTRATFDDLMRAAGKAADPEHLTIFRKGEIADAEPAVPGWKMSVDELFR